jgi:hypothetical protein
MQLQLPQSACGVRAPLAIVARRKCEAGLLLLQPSHPT